MVKGAPRPRHGARASVGGLLCEHTVSSISSQACSSAAPKPVQISCEMTGFGYSLVFHYTVYHYQQTDLLKTFS